MMSDTGPQHDPPLQLTAGPELPKSAGKAPPPPKKKRRVWPWLLLLLLLLAGAGYFFYRTEQKKAEAAKKPTRVPVVQVIVTKAKRGDIGVYYTGLGAVTPINTVTVKSRVDGELIKVIYKEGDLVHQGELLAEIDPRPFEVALTQAEGQLLKDQANLDNARIDVTRYETLVKQNSAPEQQLATQKATVKQDEGVVKTDQGTVDSAKLNITYCHIIAPMTGRIGLRLVDPGNIVHSSDANGLLVITQVQPISVIFTIAEDQLPVVVSKLHAGQQLPVDAFNHEMTQRIAQGMLTTVDNQIDQNTGTLKLRATFPNGDNALFPNQFVNARLLVQQKRRVVLLPTAAVQRNAQSTYVYVVKADSTLEMRQVKLGTTEGDQSEITDGLQEGDVTVMTGVDKLQEGTKVAAHFPGETVPPAERPKRGKK